MNRRQFIRAASAAAASGLVVGPAWSQTYPVRPVRIIAPFGAGGGGDTTIRMLAQHLTQATGQQFIVENKPGGNGVIGVQEALRGGADGYTLFYGSTTTLAANTTLMKKMSYDPVNDFAPITRVGVLPFMLVVRADQPFNTVPDLIAFAKANPGKLSYASANATGQVSGAMFAQGAGIELLHVPYKATPAGVTDVLNGTVSMMFADIPPAIGQVTAGKFRVLGVTTAARTALLPQVPAMSEFGMTGYEVVAWTAMCAPAGTAPEIVKVLNAEIVKALAKPDLKEAFAKLGVEVGASAPEELAAFIRSERERWARMIKTARIEPE
ncbi:MAG: Bug family tripartite tricarboxylate transporter substrate binding protein [Burkholderiales bacterium]